MQQSLGATVITMINFVPANSTWGSMSFASSGFLFVRRILKTRKSILFFFFLLSRVDVWYYVSFRCTTELFTIFKGYIENQLCFKPGSQTKMPAGARKPKWVVGLQHLSKLAGAALLQLLLPGRNCQFFSFFYKIGKSISLYETFHFLNFASYIILYAK